MTNEHDIASLQSLSTEEIRPDLFNLDQLSVEELVDVMCADVRLVPVALMKAQAQIVNAVIKITARLEGGGRLIYIGAGTAGRMGMLDASETGPTFNVREGQIMGILAGGDNAFTVPVENAEDDVVAGAETLASLGINDRDCVVGISASGRTPYVLGAIDYARICGSLTIGLSCNRDAPLSDRSECPIEVVVGPELIAGSTRMNSGTAQKFVLNILSTATMVRIGKTYGNLMVDLRPTNVKLRDRAVRIVARVTGASLDDAQRALVSSGWKVKVACVMIIGDFDVDSATTRLKHFDGRLRPAIESLSTTPSRREVGSKGRSWQRLGVAAIFVDGALVTGDVAVCEGRIASIGLANPGIGIVVPGFVDAQINGYACVDLLHADVGEILAMGDALYRDGVIAYQPTLITSDVSQIRRAAQQIGAARRRNTSGARILGIHLEGPFLSPLRSGTHPVEHLRTPDLDLLATLLDSGDINMMTLAAELPGAFDLIDSCLSSGVKVSLGHSAVSAHDAMRAFDAGASAVTHLFNAMDPLSARYPGLAGAALARNDVAIQLICDGVHVANELLTLAFAAAPGRCLVVSDSIAAAACDKEFVQLGDVIVRVSDGQARRSDGKLAGSIGRLSESAVRLARIGLTLSDVLAAVITRPAHLLGATELVNLKPGAPADGLLLNDQLEITGRLRAGELVDAAE
jgi:N-acetylmuramic acid 6-phosphate etherase/N-acetylglucosamine-6-phosphate deacetylase